MLVTVGASYRPNITHSTRKAAMVAISLIIMQFIQFWTSFNSIFCKAINMSIISIAHTRVFLVDIKIADNFVEKQGIKPPQKNGNAKHLRAEGKIARGGEKKKSMP